MTKNATTTKQPKILVCILNWNGRSHLEYSIPSVLSTRYDAFSILVVDNGSTDDSIEFLQVNFPQVRVTKNSCNLGWAGGNNIGIRQALQEKYDWVLLLNNDVLVDPRWLSEAMRVAELSIDIGIIGFTVFGQAFRVPKDNFYRAQIDYPGPFVSSGAPISGCAMLVRSSVFEAVGLIDETYVLYAEEEDFELRAKRAGYKSLTINMPLWHFSEGTSRRIPYRTAYLAIRNRLRKGIKLDGYGPWQLMRYLMLSLRIACIPQEASEDNSYLRRQRPSSNIFINVGLVLAAVGWNFANWKNTKTAGRADLFMADRARLCSVYDS